MYYENLFRSLNICWNKFKSLVPWMNLFVLCECILKFFKSWWCSSVIGWWKPPNFILILILTLTYHRLMNDLTMGAVVRIDMASQKYIIRRDTRRFQLKFFEISRTKYSVESLVTYNWDTSGTLFVNVKEDTFQKIILLLADFDYNFAKFLERTISWNH